MGALHWCAGCSLPSLTRRQVLRAAAAAAAAVLLPRPARAFPILGPPQEEEIGRNAHPDIVKRFGVLDSPSLQAFVARIGQRLVEEAEYTGFEYRFTALDSPEVNAFALPGGFIYVTRGLLTGANSEAEVATVLGHEIGHVTSHHAAKQLTRAYGLQFLTLGLIALSPGGREHAAKWATLSSELFRRILLGYGREAELESDEKGIRYAFRAGYDARQMVAFFRILQLKARLAGVAYHAFDATHPDTIERIDRARVLAEVIGPGAGAELRVAADEYKARLEGLAYGEKGLGRRLHVHTVAAGETLPAIVHQTYGSDARVYEVALLNGLRREDEPLAPGQRLKLVVEGPPGRSLRLESGPEKGNP
jgi:predicted Zn-dependent protease